MSAGKAGFSYLEGLKRSILQKGKRDFFAKGGGAYRNQTRAKKKGGLLEKREGKGYSYLLRKRGGKWVLS